MHTDTHNNDLARSSRKELSKIYKTYVPLIFCAILKSISIFLNIIATYIYIISFVTNGWWCIFSIVILLLNIIFTIINLMEIVSFPAHAIIYLIFSFNLYDMSFTNLSWIFLIAQTLINLGIYFIKLPYMTHLNSYERYLGLFPYEFDLFRYESLLTACLILVFAGACLVLNILPSVLMMVVIVIDVVALIFISEKIFLRDKRIYTVNYSTQGSEHSKRILEVLDCNQVGKTASPITGVDAVNKITPECVELDLRKCRLVPKRSDVEAQAQIALRNKLGSLKDLQVIAVDFKNPFVFYWLEGIGSCNKIQSVVLSNFNFSFYSSARSDSSPEVVYSFDKFIDCLNHFTHLQAISLPIPTKLEQPAPNSQYQKFLKFIEEHINISTIYLDSTSLSLQNDLMLNLLALEKIKQIKIMLNQNILALYLINKKSYNLHRELIPLLYNIHKLPENLQNKIQLKDFNTDNADPQLRVRVFLTLTYVKLIHTFVCKLPCNYNQSNGPVIDTETSLTSQLSKVSLI